MKVKVKVPRITQPQQHTLLGALLFGHVPAVFQASARALRKEGLVKPSVNGNVVLTPAGKTIAVELLARKTKQLVKRSR